MHIQALNSRLMAVNKKIKLSNGLDGKHCVHFINKEIYIESSDESIIS